MTYCLNLRPWEAAAMAAGRAQEIWRPIKPRPHKSTGYYTRMDHKRRGDVWVPSCDCCGLNFDLSVKHLYPTGAVLTCREKCLMWKPFSDPDDGIVYPDEPDWDGCLFDKAVIDADRKQGRIKPHVGNWQIVPASRVPADLARFRPVVASCEPRQVMSITEAEALAAGCATESSESTALGVGEFAAKLDFLMQWQEAYPGVAWAWRVVLEGK